MTAGYAFMEGHPADVNFFAFHWTGELHRIRRDPPDQVSSSTIAADIRLATLLRHDGLQESGSDPRFGQCSAVVPWHPTRRFGLQLVAVSPQGGEIVERLDAAQFRSMDEAHEQVAHLGPILRPVEQSIFTMQNGFLQSPFTDVMPLPGLCRVLRFLAQSAWFLTVPDAA